MTIRLIVTVMVLFGTHFVGIFFGAVAGMRHLLHEQAKGPARLTAAEWENLRQEALTPDPDPFPAWTDTDTEHLLANWPQPVHSVEQRYPA